MLFEIKVPSPSSLGHKNLENEGFGRIANKFEAIFCYFTPGLFRDGKRQINIV